ncbi:hypothetical protein N7519_007739 [Penicillium mononematosum]|uniref:uncharacterized protein n=1 Tax=Penicillium mononematosum TaxID=268346 RepID=UPI0025496E2C|nr:uncharacterized protein N7519_007739 [Penicillium mononematosum]KAJ6186438.1 hypothetical protein N7519_007739 [Penicillium mononematosum]
MASSVVDPSPADPAQEPVPSRDKYKQAARSIILALESRSKPAYTHTELAQFRVSVRSFDPEVPKFTDSETCLFLPLTQEQINEYKLDKKVLTKDEDRYLHRFEDTFDEFPQTYPVRQDCRMWDRARQIQFSLEIFESCFKNAVDEDTISIEEASYWANIRAEDSFYQGPQGMRLGLKLGHSMPAALPRWYTVSTCQWLDENLKTSRPHIKLVTLTGAEAKENELLHGELGPIANVLMLSFFGPRHGRILQAKLDNSGTLKDWSSPIYNFVHSNEKIKHFVRYNNCKPQDGKEFEPSPHVQYQASLLKKGFQLLDKKELPIRV